MDTGQAGGIRFFDLNSRIGRLRYLAYNVGLLLLMLVPLVLGGALARASTLLGGSVLLVAYIGMLVMSIGFAVRRLHDLDKSGWWWLLMLIPLVNLIVFLYILFAPGSDGENRFGPVPPPNSGWVIAGAVSYIALIPLGGILAAIAIPAYQDFVARSQMAEAIQLSGAAETQVAQYYQQNKTWPTDLSSLYGKGPAGHYVDSVSADLRSDGGFGIVATMKATDVVFPIASKTMELWTSDGGQTWHCGPGGANPVDVRYLIASCRDTGMLSQ